MARAGQHAKGWHRQDIRAELVKRYGPTTALAKSWGYCRSAISIALLGSNSWPAIEERIARALDTTPHALWPDRWSPDRTGDLVDCSAAPDGPAEYRNLTLTEIATRLCQPFGIPVRAEVDVGARFPRFSIDVSETVMSAIEKAARQRAVLVVSDGVGGVVLTRGGSRRGPEDLRQPGNVSASAATMSWKERFRDYIVKGQTRGANGGRAGSPALSVATPLTAGATTPPGRPATNERRGVVMTGRARDEGVTRYRPKVTQAKTQSGGASVQEQADWMMRVARAQSEQVKHTVQDWRAGQDATLWRTNELVLAEDLYAGLNGDMLISRIEFHYGDGRGHRTVVGLVGPAAFDVLREGDRDRSGNKARGRARGDSVARPLSGGGGQG